MSTPLAVEKAKIKARLETLYKRLGKMPEEPVSPYQRKKQKELWAEVDKCHNRISKIESTQLIKALRLKKSNELADKYRKEISECKGTIKNILFHASITMENIHTLQADRRQQLFDCLKEIEQKEKLLEKLVLRIIKKEPSKSIAPVRELVLEASQKITEEWEHKAKEKELKQLNMLDSGITIDMLRNPN